MQKFYNGIVHKQNDKGLKFIELKEYKETQKNNKISRFLKSLENKISNRKKNNSYK